MGTATNQMLTRSDVHSLTNRHGIFFNNLNKCVTKSECEGYDLLNVSSSRSSNQCIPKTDISRGTNAITIYYGIYNNKNTSAKLNYVRVQIRPSGGSWTTIGEIDPGNVSSTKTGSIQCTIPSNVVLQYSYQFRVFCGNTNSNQTWYFCWGNSDNITTISSYSWGSPYNEDGQTQSNNDRACSWTTELVAPNNDYEAVLDSEKYPNGGKGRSKLRAALFKIV